jgi:hypothetical protein
MNHLSGWIKQGGVLAILLCSRTMSTLRASNKGEALPDLASYSQPGWSNFFDHSRPLLQSISSRACMGHLKEIFNRPFTLMRQIFISLFVLLIFSAGLSWASESGHQSLLVGEGQDIFYQTPGTIEGPAVAESPRSYSAIPFVNNRLIVWFVTQQHTYFGGFVLALPIFSLLLEFLGVTRKQGMTRKQFDGLAQDILRVGLLSLSITAVLGSVMLGLFVTLYPGFMNYMGSTFKSLMPVYAKRFFLLSIITPGSV